MTGVTPPALSGLRPVYSDQARAAILSQLGPALSALPDVTAAARWPLVEALLGFLPPVPDVDARAPLMTMRPHLDALGRILREEPGSPHLPEVDQAAARAYLRHLRGPGVLDMPVARLLPTLRLIEEDLDLRVVAADLARAAGRPDVPGGGAGRGDVRAAESGAGRGRAGGGAGGARAVAADAAGRGGPAPAAPRESRVRGAAPAGPGGAHGGRAGAS